ncbi:MAG: hypothetical protein B7Z42_07090 [Brevundimonas sp. 12-68-7]|uniref:DUF4238 domain-containing protein n=1 Tax=Brevundimonas subvibrioides TaxID=74313 RepID=A0A258FKW0_9CAUL|nr:MAG: hypothetical protein B7Z42_07090 [Brevundimonas sp. 12-68-7]OYX32658.1 MAG: hypothetical protein B7Z01_10885 [Brevundimonas subvibrioides]
MADNKNQHFVPKAHLKPFSVDGEGKAIHLFNLDADRAIPNAAVRKQCSHDYLYGQDRQLETAIQTIEGAYGSAIQRLVTQAAEPTGLDRLVLRRFVLLQHLRTEAASVSASQIAAALAQLPGVLPEGEAFDPKTVMLEAVQGAMLFYARSMKIVDDLQVTLVRNRTATPFVTSDDPAVLTNRWHLQNPRAEGLAFGVRSGGAIMLLPLSPELLAVLHDPNVYSVPHRGGVVQLRRDEDVRALNDHQILNCAANLYFRRWDGREAIAEAARETAPHRRDPRHRTTYAVRDQAIGEHIRYEARPLADILPQAEGEVLVHTESLRARPVRWPRFLQYRRDGRMYSNGTRTGFVREGCLAAGFVDGVGYRRVKL